MPRFPSIPLAALLAASALLGGCVTPAGPGDATLEPTPRASSVVAPSEAAGSNAHDTGTIRGSVVSDEAMPIAGADVAVVSPIELAAKTDQGGAFEFQRLSPGSYALRVSALGYQTAARRFEVRAGDVAAASFVLSGITIREPHSSQFIDEASITLAFTAAFYYGGSTANTQTYAPGAFPDRTRFVHPTDVALTAYVGSVEWKSDTAVGVKRVLLESNATFGKTFFKNASAGQSPFTMTVLIEPATPSASNVTSLLQLGAYCTATTPADCASRPPESLVQVTLQQRIHLYTTHFHVEPPPPGYTGLPQ
ncbi:MAG TPA: carboxypeptidase-like regulatory domain-containing protein [Candidatus Thermoplasmatota archaeon]|nr:carboxypeptidase-like regulatory domain-containing protein [Candidatus Thermoplasmatota archaeon]